MYQWVLGALKDVGLWIHHQFLYDGSLNSESVRTGGHDPRNNEQDTKAINE